MKDLPECEQVLKRPCERNHGKAALYSKCTEAIHRLLSHKFRTIGDEVRSMIDGIHLEHKIILAYYAPITIQLVHTRGSYSILVADRRCEAIKHASYATLVRKMENLRNSYERYFGLKYQEVRSGVPVEPDEQKLSVEKQAHVWTFGKSFLTDGADFYYRTRTMCLEETKESGVLREEADKKGGGGEKATSRVGILHTRRSVSGIFSEKGSKTKRRRPNYKRKGKLNRSPEKKASVEAPAEMSQQANKTPQSEMCKDASEEEGTGLREKAQPTRESSKKEEISSFSMFFERPPPKWNSHHGEEDSASRYQGPNTEKCTSSPGYCSSSAVEQDTIVQTPTGSEGRSPYGGMWSYGAIGGRGGATNSHVYAVLQRRSIWGSKKQSTEGTYAGPGYGGHCEETPIEGEAPFQARGGYSGSLSPRRLSQEVRVFSESTQCTQRNTEIASAKQSLAAGAQHSLFHRGSGYPVTSSYQVQGTRPRLKPEIGDASAKLRKISATQFLDANDEKFAIHSDVPLSPSAHAVRSPHILHLSRPIVRQKSVPNARSVQAAMPEPSSFVKSAMPVGKAAEHSAMIPSEKRVQNSERMSQAVGNEEEFESQAGMPDIF